MQELANELFIQLSENERRTLKSPVTPHEPIELSQYICKVFKYIYGLKTIFELKLTDLEKRFDQELQIKLQEQKTHYLMRESDLKVRVLELQALLEQSVIKNISLSHSEKMSPPQRTFKIKKFQTTESTLSLDLSEQFLLKGKRLESKPSEEAPPKKNKLKRSRSSMTQQTENYDKSQQLDELLITNNSKVVLNSFKGVKHHDSKSSSMHLEANKNHKFNRYPQQSIYGRKYLLNLKKVLTQKSQQMLDLSSQFLICGSPTKSNLHFSQIL